MNRRTFAAALATLSVPTSVFARDAGASPRAASRRRGDDAAEAARMISEIRRNAGLPEVRVDARMNAAAEHQAREVAAAGSLSHGDFAGRVRTFGIGGSVAENLAYGSDHVGGAIAQWQGSAPHRANLLLPGARRIGLGRADRGGTRYWALVIG